MILISHRGNISGKNTKRENHPSYIDEAIKVGYDVEIDVWFTNDKLWLGHTQPNYLVDISWLESRLPFLWIHCKNLESLSYFNRYEFDKLIKFNYFSHNIDDGVLTSHGYIWSTNLCNRGILVLPEQFNKKPFEGTIGICSDDIESYKDNS